jgi:hypothetical protein
MNEQLDFSTTTYPQFLRDSIVMLSVDAHLTAASFVEMPG